MERIFGIDMGIASIGWAVIETDGLRGQVIACGTRMFDPPETPKEHTPKNQERRQSRLARRVIRRRKQRAAKIRALFAGHSLIPAAAPNALALGLDPWQCRAKALDHLLTGSELAAALGHIAIHRGFRSNAKAAANADKEESAMKSAIDALRDRMRDREWRTIGEMFAKDPDYAARKRNRAGSFTHSVLRADHEAEVKKIFAAQRRLGSPFATDAFQHDFADAAFSQRPLQDSIAMVGECPFLPPEPRAPRRAYSFELFRLLSRLAALRIVSGRTERPLTPAQIAAATAGFGAQKKLSWKWLRKTLALPPGESFAGIAADDEKNDFVARAGNAAEGTYTLREVLEAEAFDRLAATPETLDAIAAILTFRTDLDAIAADLHAALPTDPASADKLANAARANRFTEFTRAGHISSAAARALLPHLAAGMVYSDACAAAGFNHAAPNFHLEDVRNPVARKAAGEVLKQVKVLKQQFGLPAAMHIELARDLGKGQEERDKITRGINDRNKEKDKLRATFEEKFGRPPSVDDLLKYELWQEQRGTCLYSGREIPPALLAAADNTLQVDHILPWSRFGDDSFFNKTLCYAGANAEKRDRTPFEWFTETKTEAEWEAFTARVTTCTQLRRRKQCRRKQLGHYLRRNAAEVEGKFKARNLQDTKYASRLVLGLLAQKYFPDAPHLISARPGALTSKLRRGWGLEDFKKDEAGNRRHDDRHHALDAIVVAACSKSTLDRLTRAFQESERQGRGRDFARLDPPWDGFRQQALEAATAVFVSRAERHRARGKAHDATIKEVRELDGGSIVYERKSVEELELADLDRIDSPERNANLIAALRKWIEAKKPKGTLPLSPKGDPVRKVRIRSKDKPFVLIRGGTAKAGNMARVDVFSKPDKKGKQKFYLVPIYPHQIATMESPPDRAVNPNKPMKDWELIDASFRFRFSLYQNSFVEVTHPTGEIIRGYFRGLHSRTGAITLSAPENPDQKNEGIGARTLLLFRKFSIDRLGNVHEVTQETRTWRGESCT